MNLVIVGFHFQQIINTLLLMAVLFFYFPLFHLVLFMFYSYMYMLCLTCFCELALGPTFA